MTSSPKVWGDALRRLQNEMPDFAIDAWIAPLAVKVHDDRLVLGCPTSFHRDRVRIHHVETIERCWSEAYFASIDAAPERDFHQSRPVELLLPEEFAQQAGVSIETRALLQGQAKMRKVGVVANARTANGDDAPNRLRAPNRGASAFAPPSPAASFAPAASASSTGLAQPSPLRSVRPIPSRKSAPAVRDDSKLSLDSVGDRPGVPTRLPGAAGSNTAPPSAPRADLDFGLSGEEQAASDPFSFESFIVGPCNALAREATLALARRRQRSLNQLYLGGANGMGKTHLARAAATEARRMALGDGLHSPLGDPRVAGASSAHPHPRTAASRRDPRGARRVIYTSAEQFTSDFVSAMRNGRNDEWTRRYRGAIDLLVVEDIHTFTGRTKTQEELALTISHVLDSGGRVLLTGDRSPRNLTGLDESLRSQVSRGFVAELDRPDPLVRRHILRAKAAAGGINLPSECLDLLVEATGNSSDDSSNNTFGNTFGNTSSPTSSPTDPCSESSLAGPTRESSDGRSTPERNDSLRGQTPWRNSGASVRDIESLLIQVVTTASLLGRAIDVDLTRDAIDLKSGASTRLDPAKLSVAEVVRIVAAFFGKRPEALASRSRRRDVLVPRQLAMYLAHRYTDASLTEIGRGLGRDHPAVRNALTRIERQVLENAPVRYQVEALSERIDRRIEDARL